ncbi:MAG: HU family DNA-binding protein [Fibrobacteres bacterium]|nr:HU family DNA-binding protein [Fibrobacterota bacterium]
MQKTYMSVNDLAEIIANRHRIPKKEGRLVIDLIFSSIAHSLREGRETWIPEFGKFHTDQKPERSVMNPRIGRVQMGKAKIIPRIRFSGIIKGELNQVH